jgi:hypothetical protein
MFEYAAQHPSYGAVFNEAMSSYSTMDNAMVLEALDNYDFAAISQLCDVGGGHGSTLCSLLVRLSQNSRFSIFNGANRLRCFQ